jgi:CRISPR/Cas system-associated exonuclease Cas4 (RecB family)
MAADQGSRNDTATGTEEVGQSAAMNDIRRISHSELKDFQRCKRRWWLRHIRRLAPKLTGPAGALQSGTRVHTALESYYTFGNEGTMREALEMEIKDALHTYQADCERLEIEFDSELIAKFNKDIEVERAMIEGYAAWVAETGADAHLTVIDVERKHSVSDTALGADFARRFEVVAKLDLRVFDEISGTRRFMDHKTMQTFANVLPLLRPDSQMLHYHLMEFILAVADDETCSGAIYNMLRKVKRTKAAKPPFYAREVIDHNAEEVESYRLRLLGMIANVFELEARLTDLGETGAAMFAYPNPTRDCLWDCEFLQVCGMFDDGSRVEDALSAHFVERDPLARYGEQQVE